MSANIKTYDLRYVPPPMMVYLSVSDTPLPNNPKAYTKGFEWTFCEWEELYKVTKRFSYSNAHFKEGHRKISNIIGFGNLLILDVDNHYDANEVAKELTGVKSLIVTTQSHTSQHHKFRVIIPTDKLIGQRIGDDLHRELLTVTAEMICGLDADKIDRACFGKDRQYAPAANQKHRYIRGELVKLDALLEAAQRSLKAKSAIKIEPMKIQTTPSQTQGQYQQKRQYIKEHLTPEFTISILRQKGLEVRRDGKVIIPGKKTKAISVDLKTGLVRDFANDVSYDPVSILYDIYRDGTLPEITDTIYEQLKGA